MLGLLTRRTSRNKMDCDRNDEEYAKNVFKMSGQAWWLDEDGHGPMTRKVKGGLWETIGSLRWERTASGLSTRSATARTPAEPCTF